jgi:hypothetical protein
VRGNLESYGEEEQEAEKEAEEEVELLKEC